MIQCDDFDLHPIVYRAFMTSLSIITPPINIFALYCILRKSSKQMGNYKLYLLAYQLTSSTFDLVFTFLIVPVVFFPIPMGYPDSLIARRISLGAHVSLIIFISSIPFLAVCILSLFSYRCQLIIPRHHFFKTDQKGNEFHPRVQRTNLSILIFYWFYWFSYDFYCFTENCPYRFSSRHTITMQ